MGIRNPVATSEHTQDAAAAEVAAGVPLVIDVGDTSYADDYGGDNHWVLDRFWEEVEPIAANAPVMLCPGELG